MNKNAIKKFAIEARQKLIASVTDKAGMLGITAEGVSAPTTKGNDFEVYQTAAGTEVTLNKKQCEQRRRLVEQIETKGFEEVVEEVAYTWFNRICAIRFMEVNDYLPSRVRALSSEKEGKNEPDLVTQAPDVDLDLTDSEKEFVIESKMSGKLDELFAMLFVKQCNKLHEVLPELFEETSDYTEMLLSISFTNKDDVIRMLIDEVPEEDFNITTTDENGNVPGQVEIIGWLYQYYNTELKDDTFAKLKKNIKITKERIPAATQLFTPDWIVRYMVENSVGRLWIEHLRAVDPSVDEKNTAEEFGWKYYLPEAEQEESVNQQLATIRADYKNMTPEDITCIDPCMGSGHILVAMFDVLMDIYKSAGYAEREASLLIVQKNIHGLDIDKRAYQLAYFAVMMKGRQYNRRFLRNDDTGIRPNLFVVDESNDVILEHLQYFGVHMESVQREKVFQELIKMLDNLKDAKEYGSIIDVKRYSWDSLHSFINDYSVDNQLTIFNVGIELTQRKVCNLIKQAKIMSQKYDAVITNPPYMGLSGGNSILVNYVKEAYPISKSDMFAVFIEKCTKMIKKNGYTGMITQPSFLFLSSFEKLRSLILDNYTINSMLHMGRGIFGIDFGSVAFVISGNHLEKYNGIYFKLYERTFQYIDSDDIRNLFLSANCNHEYEYNFSLYKSDEEFELSGEQSNKSVKLYYLMEQSAFYKIPGTPFAYWSPNKIIEAFENAKSLGDLTIVRNGMKTGDNARFLRYWWEVSVEDEMFNAHNVQEAEDSHKKWFPYNKGGETRKWYGNNDFVINWENKGQIVIGNAKYEKRNVQDYPDSMKFSSSSTWSLVSAGRPTFRYKECNLSDIAGMSFYNGKDKTKYYLGFCNTPIASFILQMLAPTINYQAGDIARLPMYYSEEYGKYIDLLVNECIEIAKYDWNSFETSWDYEGNSLCKCGYSTVEQAMNNWMEACEKRINRMLDLENEINNIFCKIYEVEEYFCNSVKKSEVTLYVPDKKEDIKRLISYAIGCMFGRYSLDIDGLAFAGGVWSDEKYTSFLPDSDNIIPITDEEYFSDDIVGRFCEWLKIVFGEDALEENLEYIADILENKGNSSRDIIRNYFIKDFMSDHIKMYQKTPIYWLFDSGKENGFKALVYMHRYTPDTVGIVRTEYLHKTQKAIEQAMQRAEYTGENASSASDKKKAVQQITKYTKQLGQMKSYDEAMAHIANQRIEIDLDDGVKVNYEKFQGVEVAQEGKKALKIDLLAKI